ncbi:MAG: hypothetical protein ACT4QB_22010, partial [Gammaproteobacteria bacterium]
TLYQRNGAGGGFSPLASRLLDQEGGNDPVDDLQDRGEELGMGLFLENLRDRIEAGEAFLPFYRRWVDEALKVLRDTS